MSFPGLPMMAQQQTMDPQQMRNFALAQALMRQMGQQGQQQLQSGAAASAPFGNMDQWRAATGTWGTHLPPPGQAMPLGLTGQAPGAGTPTPGMTQSPPEMPQQNPTFPGGIMPFGSNGGGVGSIY